MFYTLLLFPVLYGTPLLFPVVYDTPLLFPAVYGTPLLFPAVYGTYLLFRASPQTCISQGGSSRRVPHQLPAPLQAYKGSPSWREALSSGLRRWRFLPVGEVVEGDASWAYISNLTVSGSLRDKTHQLGSWQIFWLAASLPQIHCCS